MESKTLPDEKSKVENNTNDISESKDSAENSAVNNGRLADVESAVTTDTEKEKNGGEQKPADNGDDKKPTDNSGDTGLSDKEKAIINNAVKKKPVKIDLVAIAAAKKKKIKIALIVVSSIIVVTAAVIIILSICENKRIKKIQAMSFEDCLNYTLADNSDAVITVGTIRDGVSSYTVYGNNGEELPHIEHVYEIGSLTETFTAALVYKAVDSSKLRLDNTINMYLDLPEENIYPTVRQLLTHTSGYKERYFEKQMFGNFFEGINDFYNIPDETVLERLAKTSVNGEMYYYQYSDFGYATLGLLLESVFKVEYTELINRFISEELKLSNTHISGRQGDLSNYWDWHTLDTYLSASGLTSTVTDMLAYAQMHLGDDTLYTDCFESLTYVNDSEKLNAAFGINIDAIGYAWVIDKENSFIWHNGSTDDYNCYIGFCTDSKTSVVILSNLSPDYKISATVMGTKLLKELQVS